MIKLFSFVNCHTFFEDPPALTDPATTPSDPPADRTYTQAELTTLIEQERQRHAEQTKQTIKSLEEAKRNASLTQKDKEDLAKRIADLNSTLLTKEELAKKEKEKIEIQFKTEKELLAQDRDSWKSRFVNSQITSSIVAAANEEDGFNPQVFLALLGGKSELIELNDTEGKPSGNFTVKVKLDTVDESGAAKTLTLTPREAIKSLKERPEEYGNLFKSNVNGGLGGGPSAGSLTTASIKDMSPEQYRKHRSKIRS